MFAATKLMQVEFCMVSDGQNIFGYEHLIFYAPGLVAQWITRLTTDQKIPGSNPGKLESSF